MKKRFLAGVSIFMAAIVLGAVAACGMPYDYADENDLSRWLVEFTCDHPNDLSENSAKYSVHVLSELQKNHNPFTINMPYDSAYEEMGLADPAFTLEPKTEFLYNCKGVSGERLVEKLRLKKDYYFVRDTLYRVDESNGELQPAQRIFQQGTYQIDYVFGAALPAEEEPDEIIAEVSIIINLK